MSQWTAKSDWRDRGRSHEARAWPHGRNRSSWQRTERHWMHGKNRTTTIPFGIIETQTALMRRRLTPS